MVEFIVDSFCNKELRIKQIIFHEKCDHSLYKLHQVSSTLSDKVLSRPLLSNALFTSTSNKQCNLHTSLGYPSEMILNRLAKHVNFNCKIDNAFSKCLEFSLEKEHKLPFVVSTSKSVKLFSLMYATLWIYLIVLATTAKYCLILVNHYSKYMWMYFLSTKNQT